MTESVYVDPETGEKIPMKDGKPCRVCVDIKTWKRLGKKKSGNTETAAGAPTTASVKEEVECPADVKTLGRHTWTLLHTMAAYYPEQPTPDQQNTMKQFIHSFAEVYPCWFCKEDFKKELKKEPVNVMNRDTLSQWLCRRHNEVNVKLGKKTFDCTKVFERWLTGPPNGPC